MAINVSKTTLYNTGSISFGSLRSDFKGTGSGSISASELRRNTDLTDTNPIVPDATENNTISSSNNWKTSQFRGSIKTYNLIQSGTDTNVAFQSQTWNSNLNKNIIKKIYVNGTIGATGTGSPAAQIDTAVCNLEFDVSGSIYGSGGVTSSGAGGGALYVNNTANRAAATSTVYVNVNSSGTIRGGGVAGSNGSAGSANSTNCYDISDYANRGDGGAKSSCSSAAPRCRADQLAPNYYFIGEVACNPDPNTASCSCSNRCSRCYRQWDRTCRYRRDFSVTGNGGNGGTFGVGRGYNTINSSLKGNSGNSGSTANCGSTSGGGTTGNSGSSGNDGAEWGQASAGAGEAGRAVYRGAGNVFSVRGSTGNIYGPRTN